LITVHERALAQFVVPFVRWDESVFVVTDVENFYGYEETLGAKNVLSNEGEEVGFADF